jgi:prepilin-type N-terminal cleavage/methylation domain-containing protein
MGRRKAFTLVELLVVIAIIAILIAILLPVCIKIRNRALVLASPIAYIAEDGGVYLTGPRGGYSLPVSDLGVRAVSVDGQHCLAWSACGRRVGFSGSYGPGAYAMPDWNTFVHEPSTAKGWHYIWGWPRFAGFVDDDTYLGWGAYGHQMVRVENSSITFFNLPDSSQYYYTFAQAPPMAGGGYVACIGDASHASLIVLLGRNFEPRKTLWRFPDWAHLPGLCAPAIDPFGEWVAWSWNARVMVKRIDEHTAATVTTLDIGYFCDWTEDGNLLVRDRSNKLAVYTRDGKLLRQLDTALRPLNGTAAYRKYGHQ